MDIEQLKKLLNYDYKTGVFTWISNGKKNGRVVGNSGKNGYGKISINRVTYSTHRLAWAFFYGEMPNGCIDHINGNGLDNRIENLRLATHLENNRNRNSLGVSFNKKANKWQSQIKANGKSIYLGCYSSIDDAISIYRKKSIELFGEFSRWSQS